MESPSRPRRMRHLLDHLDRTGPCARAELARATATAPRVVLDDLHFAETLGIVRRTGEGRDAKWTIDPAERRGLLDRIALRLGRGVLVFLDGTSVAEVFERLSDDTEANAKNLDRKFVHHQEPARRYADKADVLDRIIDGLVKERTLIVEYRDGPVQTLRPLTLVVYRRAVYLLALDERENVERYAVERIRTAALGVAFEYPQEWDPEAELGPYFGIYKRGAPERVVLRFAASKAELVRSRDWHSTATLRDLPDGRVEVVMRAGGPELVRFALEWGPHCEVVAPESLREAVIAELRGALAQYDGGGQETLDLTRGGR